jgi:predicted metal-dependent hydrolase
LVISLEPSHATRSGEAQWVAPIVDESHPDTTESAARLLIFLPRDASAAQIRDATKAWLLRQAHQHFVERLNHFAPQLGVRWTKLTLSNAGSRWGSAKSDGSIRLHWRLMHFRPSIIDYVVVHELSHLRVMDHSPRFWGTVATLVPDYAAQRQLLKMEPLGDWA